MSSAKKRYLEAARQKTEIKKQYSGSTLKDYKKTGYVKPSGATKAKKIKGKAIDISSLNSSYKQRRLDAAVQLTARQKAEIERSRTEGTSGNIKTSGTINTNQHQKQVERLEKARNVTPSPKRIEPIVSRIADDRLQKNKEKKMRMEKERIKEEERRKKKEEDKIRLAQRKSLGARLKAETGPSTKKRILEQQTKRADAKTARDDANIYTHTHKFFHNMPRHSNPGLAIPVRAMTIRLGEGTFSSRIRKSPAEWISHINTRFDRQHTLNLQKNKPEIDKHYNELQEKINNSTGGFDKKKVLENVKKVYEYVFNKVNQKLKPKQPRPAPIKRNHPGRVRNPPARPVPVPVAKKEGIGENQIVSEPIKPSYRAAHGADWIISQKDDQTPILKIKSTGYTEPYYQEDLPDGMKWFDIEPQLFTAWTFEGIPMTTTPEIKGKFSSTSGFKTVEKYFFSKGNNKCFEYDNDEDGRALYEKFKKDGARLEMRAGHVTGKTWYSNPGDSAIWTQYLNGMSGYPKKGTICDDSVSTRIEQNDDKGKKAELLKKTITKIRKNIHRNFIIFNSPHTHITDGFIDLNKKIALGNGWYMFEFINNLDEMHLKDETHKGFEKKNNTPIMFFMKENDIAPPKNEDALQEWGKKRKILCEWEYRMVIIKELQKNPEMLADIEKLVDFNTTEKYCGATDMMRYSEYTNICKRDALTAKLQWQKQAHETLKLVGTQQDFVKFKENIIRIFKGLKMALIIKPILGKDQDKQEEIVQDIKTQIEHIDVLKFRTGIPNASALPMPIKELENIKNAIIRDIRDRLLVFFDNTQTEFNLLSEMVCTDDDNCCKETIEQLNKIINFMQDKNIDFQNIIKEFTEYVEHLAPILHMETLSEEDKKNIENIMNDLEDNKKAFNRQWKKLIDSKTLKTAIINLMKDKISQIVKFGKQERDDLTWVDTEKGPESDKFKEMEIRQNEWLNHIGCIKTLQENLQKFNNDKLGNDKEISDIILKFTSDINEISASFALVLSNYKQQHEKEITRIAEVAAAAEKAAEEERQRKIAEAEEAEKKKLEEEARIAAEKAAEEERKRLEAEKNRLAEELDKALVKMIATWKEKLKEKELKDAEDTYRKELVIMYNEAIANNLKIKDEIETILEKLKGKEEKLKGEEKTSGYHELEHILLAEDADLTEIIKAFNKGDLKKQLKTTIDKLKKISTEATKIRKDYEINNLITHSEDIQQFINGVDKKINNLQIWSDTINTDFFSESMELFNEEGNFKDEKAPQENKDALTEGINKLNTAISGGLIPMISGPFKVLKDKLNNHLYELNDNTTQNTTNKKSELDDIKKELDDLFKTYKEIYSTYEDDFFVGFKKLYEDIDKTLELKIKKEREVISGKNETEKYDNMKKKEKEIEVIDQEYKEHNSEIDDIKGTIPSTLLYDIYQVNDYIYNGDTRLGLVQRITNVDLSDIEEGVRTNLEKQQNELVITANSHDKEFQLYNEILKDLGYKGKEEEMEIQGVQKYNIMLGKLEGTSDFLRMKELMEIKLLEWKTKAILKQDGHEHELLEMKVKTLKEAAEIEAEIARQKEEEERQRKEDERIENERLEAITAARAVEETKLKDLQDMNSNIVIKMDELKEKIRNNEEIIEQRKKDKNERRRLNNLQLQKILRHASPNLRKDLEKGNENKWLEENPGKERKDYKTEYLSEQVNTWG